ncbi:three-Cys-motif partner protein TcmP [Mucilaginibacter sp. OK098]|uniref:three-Cys-motif partner protein TcmP n=1 Tax=Mucilaginibacter sp. OK098 TaxID=1855297 RepID=UPI000919E65A|nr:three-Cys-motif partner protein TcmP [Mucilaginibacter sp. OK098]SHN33287.1 three-Cys-motif partner protein [Mucilaginibacter sp. OK098]
MSIKKYNPIQEVPDDGLIIPEVGVWGIEKYNLLGYYAELFTRSMNNKWGNLVYIDLFASSGYCKIKSTGKIIKSGAMIALSTPISFQKYIFCEEDESLLNALEIRIKRDFPNANTSFVLGSCNNKINDIINLIPRHSFNNTVLSFCFIDPFNLNIHFNTVKKLGLLKVDILMLIATGMAATRNEKKYQNLSNDTISLFLDNPKWRNEFTGLVDLTNQSFTLFLSKIYKKNIMTLGYKDVADFHDVRYKLKGKNVLLYHLAFFSKDPLGNKFWDIIRKQYAGDQQSLF